MNGKATHTHYFSNTITNRAERLNKMLHWQKMWSHVKAKNVSIITFMYKIFCCVKKNAIWLFFSFIYRCLQIKFTKQIKMLSYFVCVCVCVCAHPPLWSTKNNDVHRKSKIGNSKGDGDWEQKCKERNARVHTRSSNVDNKICNENQRRATSAYVIVIVVVVLGKFKAKQNVYYL